MEYLRSTGEKSEDRKKLDEEILAKRSELERLEIALAERLEEERKEHEIELAEKRKAAAEAAAQKQSARDRWENMFKKEAKSQTQIVVEKRGLKEHHHHTVKMQQPNDKPQLEEKERIARQRAAVLRYMERDNANVEEGRYQSYGVDHSRSNGNQMMLPKQSTLEKGKMGHETIPLEKQEVVSNIPESGLKDTQKETATQPQIIVTPETRGQKKDQHNEVASSETARHPSQQLFGEDREKRIARQKSALLRHMEKMDAEKSQRTISPEKTMRGYKKKQNKKEAAPEKPRPSLQLEEDREKRIARQKSAVLLHMEKMNAEKKKKKKQLDNSQRRKSAI